MVTIPAPQPALFRIIQRHKPVLLVLPCIFAFTAVLLLLILPKKYEAFGLVQVMPQNESLNLKSINLPVILNDSVVLSQVEIMRSPALLKRVSTELSLNRKMVQNAIDVHPLGRSYIIRIAAHAKDPVQAQNIVNQLILAYQQSQISGKIIFADQQAGWLNRHLAELGNRARQSAQKIEHYRKENGLFADSRMAVIDQQIAALSTQLIQAQADQADIDSRPADITDKVVAAQLASPVMHDLSQDESLLVQKLASMQQKYGAKHPQLLAAQAELSALRSKRAQEIRHIKESLQEEKSQAAEKVKNIVARLEELKQKQQTENSSSIPLRELEQDEKINRALYENFLKQSREIDLADGLEQPDSRIVSLAELPSAPSRPPALLVILLSGMAGLLVACFSVIVGEQFSQMIQSPDQLLQLYPDLRLHTVDFRDPEQGNPVYQRFLAKTDLPEHLVLYYTQDSDRHHTKLYASYLMMQLQKYKADIVVSDQFYMHQTGQAADDPAYIIVREGFTSIYNLHLALAQAHAKPEIIYLWT